MVLTRVEQVQYLIWQIESLRDYIELLEETLLSNGLAIFRGQSHDWPLVPRVATVNHSLPVLENERLMFETFCREAFPFVHPEPANEWEWLAVAQHHGLPTRLLDWSTNALGALWFTVRSPSPAEEHGVVWLMIPDEQDVVKHPDHAASPFAGEMTEVYLPRHVSGRVRSQEGAFTVHKFSEKTGTFVPLEETPFRNGKLIKIQVPADRFPFVRHDLYRCGVHAGSLFPDVTGVAERIRNQYLLLEDELDFPPKRPWNLR
ncbi:FRG domain-containing protein [Geotalea sp. SG265]|uniref:FRG domain-containing protein n=1 Tax=Geotalea sp. SG265 TaxID=2922867 RepID=UPI001FAFB33B|nr:FRG domain-containing protein [Geotalea sp. SG265]